MSLPLYAILIALVSWFAQAGAADHATVRIIVVGSAEEAARIAGLLANGADFAVLAKSVSTDPSAERGGLLGRVDIAALRPELRDALQGLKPGAISPVATIPTGFAILTVIPDAAAPPAGAPAPSALNQGIVATGGVKYMLSVDGLGEMIAALQAFPKPDDWNQDPRSICRTRVDAVADAMASMERALLPTSELRARWQPLDIVQGAPSARRTVRLQGRAERGHCPVREGARHCRHGCAGRRAATGRGAGDPAPSQVRRGQRRAGQAWRPLSADLEGARRMGRHAGRAARHPVLLDLSRAPSR